jgi:hypothetical protein
MTPKDRPFPRAGHEGRGFALVGFAGCVLRRGGDWSPPYERTAGHLDDEVPPGVPIHAFAFAMLPVLRDEPRLIELIDEVVQIVICLEYHIPAASSIAAIRSSLGPEGFAAERDAAATAVTGAGEDLDFIHEHGAGSKKARRMASPVKN